MEIEFELENESFFWEETFLKHFLNFLKIKFVYFVAFKVGTIQFCAVSNYFLKLFCTKSKILFFNTIIILSASTSYPKTGIKI